jgi:hypothetical protein
MAVTVKWNGTTTVEQSVETPGDGMSIGEYCTAFADAHGIDADLNPRFTVDGETLPADAPVDTIDGTTAFLTVDAPSLDNDAADDDQERTAGARPLGRHVEHDPASRNFEAARATKRKTVTHKRTRKPFDQGELGSCTGNALTGVLVTAPWKHSRLSERTAVELYELATTLDSTPGEYPPDDTGSSGLAVCKAAQQKGLISAYHHAFGIDHALDALVIAPVIIGIPWYSSFDEPTDGILEISDDAYVRGGHEVELLGIDVKNEFVEGVNSWGTGWGAKGRFTMSWDTLARLLAEDGDCTVPVP